MIGIYKITNPKKFLFPIDAVDIFNSVLLDTFPLLSFSFVNLQFKPLSKTL